jgi:hypothetical protein
MKRLKMIAVAAVLVAPAAVAQEAVTVQSLLKQQFAVTGAITSPIGPGVFLQKQDQLYLCFIVETPQSPTVATRYCKPVR